ncbi:coiled-coil-helix-coiled-coil-helix domain-containing protein 5 [Clarias gariepinus]|uniref:coiled-coil-helix-coiled-coil-helix domain-containing protein 5 n=1 Tax=Clarias gariepinus TaxID=13013 RepID=UPI00234CAAC7|nr:coiled-coil-helix-coiled-coil-helix domain-containing protein 5 [Clarias gariepinus]
MQAAMDITAKFCQKEMEEYGACVASNPSSWQEQCHHLKVKVAQCTSSHPVIRKIRADCGQEFAEFERCLKENQSSAQACLTHVTRFLTCANTVDVTGLVNPESKPT